MRYRTVSVLCVFSPSVLVPLTVSLIEVLPPDYICHPVQFSECAVPSVPARFGKGQGAKEIGHNPARERPKFGHNLVRK